MKRIIIGTRASKLAMIQTQWVVERLQRQWPTLDIVIEQIRTTGDHNIHAPLTQIGGDGVFVMEIEHALAKRRIDLAVHSLKDLPTAELHRYVQCFQVQKFCRCEEMLILDCASSTPEITMRLSWLQPVCTGCTCK